MTIHHSLYAHNRLRNARTTGSSDGGIPVLDFRNNVIYDAKELTSHSGSQAISGNWVGNTIKDRPSSGIEGHEKSVLCIVRDVRSGTSAMLNYETDLLPAARWQTDHSLEPPIDTDGDGIPDDWEDSFGLDKKDPSDAAKKNLEDHRVWKKEVGKGRKNK